MILLPARISQRLKNFRAKELAGVNGTETRIKVHSENGETKWLRVDEYELLAILAVLEPVDLKQATECGDEDLRPELPRMD